MQSPFTSPVPTREAARETLVFALTLTLSIVATVLLIGLDLA